jgi:small multidrug resistance family-3 protein
VNIVFFCLAAFFEIAGCFAFWMWIRNGRSAGFAALGVLSLILFAVALTRVDAAFAGRAFAAYGGIYISASLLWLTFVERVQPDKWDIAGGVISVAGTLLILFGRR